MEDMMPKKRVGPRPSATLNANQVFGQLRQARKTLKMTLGRLVARYQIRSKVEGTLTEEEDEAVDQVLGELRNALQLLDEVLEHRAAKALKVLV
jgi:hypothetical protein